MHLVSDNQNQEAGANINAITVSPIEDILADYAQGKMVILVDDEDRENEGDLLIAAECIKPEHINFMASHARGLICMTLSESRCKQINLPLMVQQNSARYATNFTVSIEAAEGVTTGISATDRATTVLAAIKKDAKPEDIASPGHIFPVMAQPGGVLTRAGHTEAGVDLARLAGFEPSSVICEILNADGTMARLPDLLEYGKKHNIKIGTIADLITYRLKHEPTLQRLGENIIETEFGPFKAIAYEDTIANDVHMALLRGEVDRDSPVLVRVHVNRGVLDILSDYTKSGSWSLRNALKAIADADSGVVVLVGYDEDAGSIKQRLNDMSDDADKPDSRRNGDLRMLGAGGQILADLGVGKMQVMGSEKRMHGLSGFGLEISGYVAAP